MSGRSSGVYGKHPGQADFVHDNAGEFARAGLDRWFEEATEALKHERGTLPEAPVAFLFPDADPEVAFAGSFVASRDSVGRSFPLILFAVVRSAGAGASLSALRDSCAAFIDAASALAAETSTLSVADVAARVATLPPPGSSVVETGPLDGEPVGVLTTALGDVPGALGYALRTCIAACEQSGRTRNTASGAAITVDAPNPTRSALAFWTNLMTPRLDGARPSLLWTTGPGGRLLVALGPPPRALLAYLANPRHQATRFWPLGTDSTAAIDGAMKALTEEQRRLIDAGESSLADLLAAFAP